MLSSHNRVWNDRTSKIVHAPPHLMFYAPYATQKDLGDFAGRQFPYVVLEGRPDAYIIGAHFSARVATDGCRVWIKEGHLRHVQAVFALSENTRCRTSVL
jgi:hypothetical protein